MNKKSILSVSIIIIFSCIVLFICFQPETLIQNINSCSISRVIYKGNEINDKDGEQRILKLLTNYKSRLSFEFVNSYSTENVVVEIDGTDNAEPFHIVLGEGFFKYEHAGGFKQNIIHGSDLLKEIENFLILKQEISQ